MLNVSDGIIIAFIGFLGIVTTALITSRSALKKAKTLITDQKHLSSHPVFSQLDTLETWVKTRYFQKDLGRTALSREMLLHKIRIWRPLLTDVAKEFDDCYKNCKLGSQSKCMKVYTRFNTVVDKGLEGYVSWHREPVVVSSKGREYTAEDKETMDMYARKFQDWNYPLEEMRSQMVHDIGESMLYDNCRDRAWDILTVFQAVYVGLKPNAEKTLKSLNGDLTGKKFLGMTIGG